MGARIRKTTLGSVTRWRKISLKMVFYFGDLWDNWGGEHWFGKMGLPDGRSKAGAMESPAK